jgi:protein TonB
MKIKSYRLLFGFLSFLSDKTNGFPLFAKYKLMLGTLIIGLSASSYANKKANSQTTCYEAPAVEDSTQVIVGDTIQSDTLIPLTPKRIKQEVMYYEISDTVAKIDTSLIYTKVEQMPEFPGGVTELLNFLHNNLTYPKVEGTCYVGMPGRVTCRFVVEKDGTISNIEVLKGVDPMLNKDAIRVIELMPKWIPGKQDGKIVRVYFILPISHYQQ